MKLIYGGIFFLAFLLTTGVIYYLNSNYTNIFQFDFTPIAAVNLDSLNTVHAENVKKQQEKLNEAKNDSLGGIQPVSQTLNGDTTAVQDSISKINPLAKNDQTLITDNKNENKIDNKPVENSTVEAEKNKVLEGLKLDFPAPSDTNYRTWTKKTAGLFESMDPKKAAKIIERYSDNIARDIIYIMKKKKAAEVLAELSPDTASRITRTP